MTVFAGYGGQKLIDRCVGRIAEVRSKLDAANSRAVLEADGGITAENAARVVGAGATAIVAGSAVFGSSDPKKTVETLRGVTK
jgi:ribulose-phosphate 3-epimerase